MFIANFEIPTKFNEINNIIFRNLGSVFCKDACPVYKIAENTSESLKGEIH